MPTWNDFVNHPNYDQFWQKQAFAPHIGAPKVPNLNVAGWWDQEDFYGPVKIFELFEKNDPDHLNYLVAGPWNHGGWARRDGSKLGEISFDSNTSKYFRTQIEAPWFAYWLKDKGARDFPKAMVFQTGSNHWEKYDAWPPRNARNRNLYLRESGALSFDPPAEDGQVLDSYISDPAHPGALPASADQPDLSGRRVAGLAGGGSAVRGQPPRCADLADRAAADDLKIAGDIAAELYCSTTGTDSDWVVKLIDVYPEFNPDDRALDGYELMIADEILRGRFRESFEHPQAIAPNAVAPYRIDLHTNDHAFLKGHRIMVQVQSTWFPLYDRNPQTFVENIFKAHASDYQAATQKVFRSQTYPRTWSCRWRPNAARPPDSLESQRGRGSAGGSARRRARGGLRRTTWPRGIPRDPRIPAGCFAIDLSRLPSHGREVATFLRGQKATGTFRSFSWAARRRRSKRSARCCRMRCTPCPGGCGPRCARRWRTRPANPVVPAQMMERYASRSAAQKLGIREGAMAALIDPPRNYASVIGELPAGATLRR
jgi:hypothetical protein